eukprot:3706734-Pleurochrysis_carterae.AAC.8
MAAPAYPRCSVNSAPAKSSRLALLLFFGPIARPDSTASFLERCGLTTDPIDNDETHRGGPLHNSLADSVYKRLLIEVGAPTGSGTTQSLSPLRLARLSRFSFLQQRQSRRWGSSACAGPKTCDEPSRSRTTSRLRTCVRQRNRVSHCQFVASGFGVRR